MRLLKIKNGLLFLLLLSVLGCSKPESRLIGKWINEKTSSVMEFNSDKTGVIHQRTRADIPPDISFNWTMVGKDQFTVQVSLPGAQSPPAARGRLEAKDTFILEDDTFKKMK